MRDRSNRNSTGHVLDHRTSASQDSPSWATPTQSGRRPLIRPPHLEAQPMMRTSLDQIDAVVEGGGCVISAERSAVLAVVKEAIKSGRSATFYLTQSQFDAINEWYWTAERRKELSVEEVSSDEKQRIEYG